MELCLKMEALMVSRLSLDKEVLLAASNLEQQGGSPFTAEELVVAAWREFPGSFGMEGLPQYPDSNRVYTKLMGKKGLAGRGWLVKVSDKRYQLSEAGRLAAQALMASATPQSASRALLSRDQKRLVERLLRSKAVAKVQENNTDALGFGDACSFWDISPRSNAHTLQARLGSVEAVIDTVAKTVLDQGELALTQGGRVIGPRDVELLESIHRILLTRFQGELDVIGRRQDERVFR